MDESLNNSEEFDPEKIDISSDLSSAMEIEDLVEDDIKKFNILEIEKQKNALAAQELAKNYPYSPSQHIPEELFPSFIEDDNFVKGVATKLYIDMDKKATKYIKTWCQANDFNQVWSIPKISQMRSKLQYKNVFEPLQYAIKMRHKYDENKNFTLIQFMPTATEARIQGAKKIGFLESLEYKALINEIPHGTMNILNSNKTYMEDVKHLAIFNELKDQIEKVRFVPADIRAKWAADLEARVIASRGII